MISGAELLEQAVHLCRSNLQKAMIAYWTGTAPFLVTLLYFFDSITGSATGEGMLVPWSFALAALWLWMNFWHTVCCDALWRSVSDEPGGDWPRSAAVRAIATNAALQGPGMFVLAAAVLVTLPFPWAYAFYQNCHVYAARFDLRETIRRAGRQSALWPKQGWQLLSCVVFLGFVLFLNVLLGIALGAQLLNTIFGIQTVLVQSQFAILTFPYLAAAACFTFLLVDPVWKAAHVIRCFHGESTRTGADLRLMLRKVTAAALLILFVPPHAPSQTAPAGKYDQAIKEVLQRPEYEWTSRQAGPAKPDPGMSAGAQMIRDWFFKAVRWFNDWLRKLTSEPPQTPGGTPPGAGLRWVIAAAFVVCAACVLLLVVRSRRRAKLTPVANSLPVSVAVDVADESVTPDQLPANEWLQLADGFLRSGDTRLAARAIYLAALSQLEGEKLITLGRHKTNLEYDRELARRARSAPQVRSAFRSIAETFERSWYGRHKVEEDRLIELKSSLSGFRIHA